MVSPPGGTSNKGAWCDVRSIVVLGKGNMPNTTAGFV